MSRKDCKKAASDSPQPAASSSPVTRSPTGRSSSLPKWLPPVALVILTFLAYYPTWQAGFAWDDDLHITKNPNIFEPGGLKQIWFSRDTPQYYPLVFTSFRLEYSLWRFNPSGYHLTNIALHALSAILFWRIFRRLNLPGAWMAAAIFAVHPVNVETVAWISERKNTLCMVFFLLALALYVRSEDGNDLKVYWLSVIAFIFALLSKTAVAPMPFVLLAIAWWRRGSVTRSDILRSAPFFAASVALALVTVWFEHQKTGGSAAIRSDGFWSHLAGAGWAVWFYLYKAVLPLNLTFIYPRWHINPSNPLVYLPGLLLIAVFVLLWPYRRTWCRHVLFALGFFVLMLLPVLGFMNIGFLHYAPVADHWQYFSIIAPIALTVGFVRSKSSALAIFAGTIVLAVLGALTWHASSAYVSSETLWRDTLRKNPAASVAHHELGLILEHQGRTGEAIAEYRTALQGEPDFPIAELNLGVALQSLGQNAEAQNHFLAALRLLPDFPEAHNNLGNLLLKQGDPAGALSHCLTAIRLRPDWADPHYNAGNAHVLENRIPEAIAEYSEAIRLNRNHAEAHQNLGYLFEKSGNFKDAAAHYTEVIRLNPGFAAVYNRLSIVLARQNRFPEAVQAAENGLRLATASGQTSLAGEIEARLKHYRDGLPDPLEKKPQ